MGDDKRMFRPAIGLAAEACGVDAYVDGACTRSEARRDQVQHIQTKTTAGPGSE